MDLDIFRRIKAWKEIC